jgi:hypothetical protein
MYIKTYKAIIREGRIRMLKELILIVFCRLAPIVIVVIVAAHFINKYW